MADSLQSGLQPGLLPLRRLLQCPQRSLLPSHRRLQLGVLGRQRIEVTKLPWGRLESNGRGRSRGETQNTAAWRQTLQGHRGGPEQMRRAAVTWLG